MGAQAKKKGPVKGGKGGRKANKQSSETAPSWALEQLALEQEEEESDDEEEVRTSPHRTAPHRTAPHRTALHCTAVHLTAQRAPHAPRTQHAPYLVRKVPEGEQGCFARLEHACSLCGAEPAAGSGQKWKACGACGITQYCSADCQREAWKRPVGHKSSCGAPLPTPGAVAAASPEALAALLAQWCRADVEL